MLISKLKLLKNRRRMNNRSLCLTCAFAYFNHDIIVITGYKLTRIQLICVISWFLLSTVFLFSFRSNCSHFGVLAPLSAPLFDFCSCLNDSSYLFVLLEMTQMCEIVIPELLRRIQASKVWWSRSILMINGRFIVTILLILLLIHQIILVIVPRQFMKRSFALQFMSSRPHISATRRFEHRGSVQQARWRGRFRENYCRCAECLYLQIK